MKITPYIWKLATQTFGKALPVTTAQRYFNTLAIKNQSNKK